LRLVMAGFGGLKALAMVFLTILLCGCGSVHNYLNPQHPCYVGTHGIAPVGRAPLRVVTFNIKNGIRLREAIEAFRSHAELREADVLLLQEMDGLGVELIARALAVNHVYFPVSVHPLTCRDFGNAILSPWPLDLPRKVILPHADWPNGQRRAAVSARVRIDGRPVLVYSVHLGAPIRTRLRERRDQVETVVADARNATDPVILGGDFNSYGLGPVLEADGFTWVTKSVKRTAALWSFDHVFARGFSPNDPHAAGVARDVKGVSDHRPVWATLLPAGFPPSQEGRTGSILVSDTESCGVVLSSCQD
jgi:endonuclease/exonuclease/phosphatase family metal-dependent hydrolase